MSHMIDVHDPRLRIKKLVLEQDDVNHVIVLEEGVLILDDFDEPRQEPQQEQRVIERGASAVPASA